MSVESAVSTVSTARVPGNARATHHGSARPAPGLRRRLARGAGVGVLLGALAIAAAPGCSLGNGNGSCKGTLDVPDCWAGSFDLHPDFFAAVPNSLAAPTNGTDPLQIRIQRGGDYETFSDGLLILVDDAGEIRGDSTSGGVPRPSLLGQPLVVGLPSSVTTPGVPVSPKGQDTVVHAAFYLNATCRTQNDALYALSSVTTNADGSCSQPDGGAPPLACEGAATSAGPVRSSSIVFNALFDGNPSESNAADLLSDGTFHLYLADPREICPGGLGPPPRCRGELTGTFHFYFQRGRPAQPFP